MVVAVLTALAILGGIAAAIAFPWEGGAGLTTGGAPSASPSPEVTATPAPSAPPSTLKVGGKAEVAGTDSCLRVREGPGMAAPINFCIPDGTVVSLVEGPQEKDGDRWWRLAEHAGWAAETYLKPKTP